MISWQHGYVKFMVICGIVCIPFAFVVSLALGDIG